MSDYAESTSRAERSTIQFSESFQQQQQRQTSQRLFDDAYSRPTARRGDCTQAQNAERVPAFLPGGSHQTCQTSADSSTIDIPNIYNQLAPSVARIDQAISSRANAEEIAAGAPSTWRERNGPQGSAVAVARSGDSCYLATAAHVARGNQDLRIHNSFAVFSDGSRFPTETSAIDRGRDLAIMTVRMGSEANRLCRPVELADGRLQNNQPLASLGFPDGSRTMHIAPGQLRRQGSLGQFVAPEDLNTYGFDPRSNSIHFDSAVHGGMSGGPVVDENARLVGINSVSDEDSLRYAISPRLDNQSLRRLLNRAQRR